MTTTSPADTQPESTSTRSLASRRTVAPRPWWKRVGYDVTQAGCALATVSLFQLRCFGREKTPPSGPVLVCANHQSFFDPILLGVCLPRRMNYVARKTLFKIPLFRSLIRFYDAIPVDRDGLGIEGIKETLRRLRRDEMVLIFPEGTRSRDGEVASIKRGICALARRSNAALLPVAVDGAFQAWPRWSPLPRPAQIEVHVGEALTPEQIASLTDDQLLEELEARIRICHANAKKRVRGNVG